MPIYNRFILLFFIIAFTITLIGCDGISPSATNSIQVTESQEPIVVKAIWTQANPLIWENKGKVNIEENTTAIDLPKAQQKIPIDLHDFKPLRSQPKSKHFSWDDCLKSEFDLSAIKTIPLSIRMGILGKPQITKTTLPQMKFDASEPILIFNKDQGVIPGANTNVIIQDKLGRIWIGTNQGLVLFDGEYSYLYQTKEGLSENRVWSLLEDKDGLIWVGTFFGLDVIDPKVGTIGHVNGVEGDLLYGQFGFSLFQDAQENIWFGTGQGSFLINKASNSLQKIPSINGLTYQGVRQTMQDRRGRIWSANSSGFEMIDLKLKIRYTIPNEYAFTKINPNIIQENKNGIYLMGNDLGLLILDENRQMIALLDSSNGLNHNYIRSITQDKEGLIYLGSPYGGLTIYDPQKGTIKSILDKDGLSSNNISYQFWDKDNQLWLCSNLGGLNIMNSQLGKVRKIAQNQGLKLSTVSSMIEDKKGNVWLGGFEGLNMIHQSKGNYDYYKRDNVLSGFKIVGINEDSKGQIWLATGGSGVKMLDTDKKHLLSLNQNNGLGIDIVHGCMEDRSGDIWISTITGLNIYSPKTHEMKLGLKQGKRFVNVFRKTLIDDSDNVWIASREGVDKFQSKDGSLLHLKIMDDIPNPSVNTMLMARGYVWIGTEEDGLYIYHLKNETIQHLSKKNGLGNDYVISLIENDGEIFVATDKGITVVRMDENGLFSVNNYNKSQGLSSIDFNSCSAMKTRNGQLWWGVGDGIIQLEPAPLSPNITKTQIVGIDIAGKTIDFNSSIQVQEALKIYDTIWNNKKDTFYSRADPELKLGNIAWTGITSYFYLPEGLSIPYNQNQLTFHFTGTHVSDPDHARYRYILEGSSDEQWNQLDPKNYAEYRNLSPGKYTFKVTSCGLNGICGLPAVFSFTIRPPWWQTGIAYTSYVFLLVSLMVGTSRYRNRIFKKQKVKLEQTVDQRTRQYREQKERAERSEKFKQLFLANMSHEIRTPMNAVMGMTNILLDKNPSHDQKNYLDRIKHSAENLLVIINDILDVSKIEEGKMELEHIDFDLGEVVKQAYQTLQYKAEEKGLTFNVNIGDSVPKVLVGDPARLDQIIINLIGNAIKFTEQGSVGIAVFIKELNQNNTCNLVFQIADTGIGMSELQQRKIFESFIQASSDTNRKYGGTGLGLSISKQLIELMGGHIEVKSEESKGSVFSFEITFPVSSNVLVSPKDLVVSETMLASLVGIKILLAEDNEYNRIVARDSLLLKIKHVQIDEAINGKEAIDKLNAGNVYDLILMDIQMPEMDGLEATRRIRNVYRLPIPIIALTASVIRSDIEKCMEVGMNAFVGKPFRINELLLVMYNVLNKVQNLEPIQEQKLAHLKKARGQVTDLTFLKELTEYDETKINKYINMYLKSAPLNLGRIQEGLANTDYEEIRITIHGMKPHLLYMGMDQAKLIADEVEVLASEKKEIDRIDFLMEKLNQYCRKSYDELEQEML